MAEMAASDLDIYQSRLEERRSRLESLQSRLPASSEIQALLRDVDEALERLSQGGYGLCESCHEPIEKERLLADPLVRVCLDHLDARQRQALEEDLQTARRVQNALLPPRQQQHSGWEIAYVYEPAGVVSGDYCDIVADPALESVLVLLGDVAGKGVAASLLMSHLHAMFRSLSAMGEGIDRMMERANRLLCESTQPDHYATLVSVQAGRSGEIAVSNAGHCPPLLVTSRDVSLVDSTGLPLGMFCAGSFPARTFELHPGDTLVLYSDGVLEAAGAGGQQYGLDRLQAGVAAACSAKAAQAVVHACLKDWRAFLAGAGATDDVALLALRRL